MAAEQLHSLLVERSFLGHMFVVKARLYGIWYSFEDFCACTRNPTWRLRETPLEEVSADMKQSVTIASCVDTFLFLAK